MFGKMGHFISSPMAKKNSKNVDAVLFASLIFNNNSFNCMIHDRKDIKKKTKKQNAKKDAKGYYLEMTQEYLAGNTAYFDEVTFQQKD